MPIKVPALKERREDIHLLFRKFSYDFAEKYHTQSVQLEPEAARLLETYPWPGNIRELKNLAEQVSVLSEKRILSAQELVNFIPQITSSNLPMRNSRDGGGQSFEERDLLYKLLFDMKNDLNDLKSLVFELIKSNNLDMPDLSNLGRTSGMPQLAYPQMEQRNNYSNSNYFPSNEPDRKSVV